MLFVVIVIELVFLKYTLEIKAICCNINFDQIYAVLAKKFPFLKS